MLPHFHFRLDGVGTGLLSQFLALQSKNRILAYDAMRHPFFEPLGKRVLSIPSGEQLHITTNQAAILYHFIC